MKNIHVSNTLEITWENISNMNEIGWSAYSN